MPSTTRGLSPFASIPGWAVVKTTRLIVLAFHRSGNTAALRRFVVAGGRLGMIRT
ncbi:MAG: hypothetical protein KA788_08955 [Lacunisphaera sp.]|jgi:hypothetical protein|nr:hypothetical protein [Lacunisphaera sp.]